MIKGFKKVSLAKFIFCYISQVTLFTTSTEVVEKVSREQHPLSGLYLLRRSYSINNKSKGLTLWWELSTPNNVSQVQFPDPFSYASRVCWSSTMLREVFLLHGVDLIWMGLVWFVVTPVRRVRPYKLKTWIASRWSFFHSSTLYRT